MTRIAGVGHIGLVTRDLERLAAFYEDVFGAEIGERSDVDEARLQPARDDDPARLRASRRAARRHPRRARTDAFARGRIDHVSLEAVDLDAFVAVRDRLVELGAADGTVVDFSPLVSVFFADPDGFHAELNLTKTADWDRPSRRRRLAGAERRRRATGVRDRGQVLRSNRGSDAASGVRLQDLTPGYAFVAARDRLVELAAADGTVVDFSPLVSVFFADPDGFHAELNLTKTADWDRPSRRRCRATGVRSCDRTGDRMSCRVFDCKT